MQISVYSKRFGLKCAPDQWQAVCELARQKGVTVSSVIHEAIDHLAAEQHTSAKRP